MSRHQIDLPNDEVRPIHFAPYPAGCTARQFAAAEINGMLAEEVIKPASTEWAAPVVFVAGKNGSLRCCADYCKLNVVTITYLYHIHRMDECIYSLQEATLFSALDANSGY